MHGSVCSWCTAACSCEPCRLSVCPVLILCVSTTGKYKECPLLPELHGGHASCRSIEGGSVCDLECDVDREFTSSVDPTPQICIDGEWSYQEMQVPFPTCEGTYDWIIYYCYNDILCNIYSTVRRPITNIYNPR